MELMPEFERQGALRLAWGNGEIQGLPKEDRVKARVAKARFGAEGSVRPPKLGRLHLGLRPSPIRRLRNGARSRFVANIPIWLPEICLPWKLRRKKKPPSEFQSKKTK